MKNCIFIWIPKCAGTTIHHAFSSNGYSLDSGLIEEDLFSEFKKSKKSISTIGHLSFQKVKRVGWYDKKYIDTAWKFALVRNPYARIFSLHRHLFNKDRIKMSFEEFLNSIDKKITPLGLFNEKGNSLANPQYKWIYDKDMKPIVDFIGHVENIQNDFKYVCKQIGIDPIKVEHYNKRASSTGYLRGHTQKTIELTKKIYKKDFELFGYSYDINNKYYEK